MAKIGYVREIRKLPASDQLSLISSYICDQIVVEKKGQEEWDKLFPHLKSGDVLIVCSLNVLFTSLTGLLDVISVLDTKGVLFKSLAEKIDPDERSPFPFSIHILNEFERQLKSDRAAVARAVAKKIERTGGRPPLDEKLLAKAKIEYENSDLTATQISEKYGVSRRKFFLYLKEQKQNQQTLL